MKKNIQIVYTTYKPTQSAIKKAKAILDDLLSNTKKTKLCTTCHKSEFVYDNINEYYICANINCKKPKIVYDPLHGCKLNYVKIELIISMIIDMQELELIYKTTKLSKLNAKKWINKFIEQINWSKYKLDKDVLDIRAIYGTIEWTIS